MAPRMTNANSRSSLPRRQQGVVLLIALIVLVAMTLAGIGMMRSIDTGTMVAGNIGFRQSAVATGDGGIEQAITWLVANADRGLPFADGPARSMRWGSRLNTDGGYPLVVGGSPAARPSSLCAIATRVRLSNSKSTSRPSSRKPSAIAVAV